MMATQRSLTNRLRQHSRRSGFAVGLSMAAAIAICIAGFIAIYVQLQPFISDFVSQDPPGQEARVVVRPDPTEAPSEDEEADAPVDDEPAPTEEPEDDAPAEEAVPEPTDEPEGFDPDLQSNSQNQINLRAQPNTSSEILTVLTISQPLQSTGETAAADNPAQDGDLWVQVQTQDDLEGWMREIDTEPFQE